MYEGSWSRPCTTTAATRASFSGTPARTGSSAACGFAPNPGSPPVSRSPGAAGRTCARKSIVDARAAAGPAGHVGQVLDIAAALDRMRGAAVPNRADLFADIDSMQPASCTSHRPPDATMRFGNAPPVRERTVIRDAWASFCETRDGVRHDVFEQWD